MNIDEVMNINQIDTMFIYKTVITYIDEIDPMYFHEIEY